MLESYLITNSLEGPGLGAVVLLAVVPLLEVVVDVVVLPIPGEGGGEVSGIVWEESVGVDEGASWGPFSSPAALLTSKLELVIHLQTGNFLYFFIIIIHSWPSDGESNNKTVLNLRRNKC